MRTAALRLSPARSFSNSACPSFLSLSLSLSLAPLPLSGSQSVLLSRPSFLLCFIISSFVLPARSLSVSFCLLCLTFSSSVCSTLPYHIFSDSFFRLVYVPVHFSLLFFIFKHSHLQVFILQMSLFCHCCLIYPFSNPPIFSVSLLSVSLVFCGLLSSVLQVLSSGHVRRAEAWDKGRQTFTFSVCLWIWHWHACY